MGSLPNLRSLSSDPNTVYQYELCDPENDGMSTKSESQKKISKLKGEKNSNVESLGEMNNIQISNFHPQQG